MKIAIYIDEHATKELGGGFSYLSRLISLVDQYDFDSQLEIVYVTKYHNVEHRLTKEIFYFGQYITSPIKLNFLNRIINRVFSKVERYVSLESALEISLLKNNVDLLYYPMAETYVFNYPYIMTSWDIGHRSSYSFPEVTMNQVFELRDFHRMNSILKSTAVIVESETSKLELVKYLNIYEPKVFILPLPPGSLIEEVVSLEESVHFLKKLSLENVQFYLYPAQFWSHKNHYNLVKGFKLYLSKYPDVKLVFTGSDKGNLSYIKEVVASEGLNESVIFLGFVSDKELKILYQNTISLVFPTLIGPTNMPPLEAKMLGCKVICSDLPGHKTLLGESALYFDALNPRDIAAKMVDIMFYDTSSFSMNYSKEEFVKKLEEIFIQIIPFRMTFGRNFNQC